MEVKAVYKYARISAKKMRDVARAVQGMTVSQATDTLSYTPKKGAYLLNKALKSAVANAENNKELAADSLFVKSVMVDEGPTQRRTMPRARGSANMIRKRTSHITVVLASKEA
ncbi:50S ribosomal protein L22 [Akkermansia glycaniphila]|uniref:Large ribosomal subunit protein uL22 n=1 Tax=Akkermansia glycaniphila TaxID=1679444 RepID=A0A1C7PCM0_9BACT|nr:50S ribosomal protein L22 [Akkermansia glycaniphila]MBT9448549.1 50S ribosomal protein L22 [Akkermansia glycaniphila]OCA03320.1 50S ribosomal protein L22 [Akkermansia glycaniphila]SEH80558.1 ribosomal protein l22/l17 [Akkermansia glycaniphila]